MGARVRAGVAETPAFAFPLLLLVVPEFHSLLVLRLSRSSKYLGAAVQTLGTPPGLLSPRSSPFQTAGLTLPPVDGPEFHERLLLRILRSLFDVFGNQPRPIPRKPLNLNVLADRFLSLSDRALGLFLCFSFHRLLPCSVSVFIECSFCDFQLVWILLRE